MPKQQSSFQTSHLISSIHPVELSGDESSRVIHLEVYDTHDINCVDETNHYNEAIFYNDVLMILLSQNIKVRREWWRYKSKWKWQPRDTFWPNGSRKKAQQRESPAAVSTRIGWSSKTHTHTTLLQQHHGTAKISEQKNFECKMSKQIVFPCFSTDGRICSCNVCRFVLPRQYPAANTDSSLWIQFAFRG